MSCKIHGEFCVAGRGSCPLGSAPIGVAEPVPQCSELFHDLLAAAENLLEHLFAVIVGGEL